MSKPVRKAQLRKKRALDLHLGLDLEKECGDGRLHNKKIMVCEMKNFLASMSQTVDMTRTNQKTKNMTSQNLIRVKQQE